MPVHCVDRDVPDISLNLVPENNVSIASTHAISSEELQQSAVEADIRMLNKPYDLKY
jgi:hypothetical protein